MGALHATGRGVLAKLTARSALSVLVLGLALLAGTAIGETRIPFDTILSALANRIFGADYPIDKIDEGIIWAYRLPRAVTAACCGAALALSGVVLQSLLRNPLAEPYLMGISAGASTGAVLVTVAGLGGGMVSMSFGALIGGITAFGLVAGLAAASGAGSGMKASGQIILAGIAGSQMFNAITSFIITKSANSEQARGIMFWLLGNLSGVRWDDLWLAVPVALIGLIICLLHMRVLDAFGFGAESAASLGVNLGRTQVLLIGTASAMTALMVSIVGAVGFVGLVVPHAARLMFGTRHYHLIPASALLGAVFLIGSDILSRTLISGQVLPIGVITSLIGAPCFAVLLLRMRRQR